MFKVDKKALVYGNKKGISPIETKEPNKMFATQSRLDFNHALKGFKSPYSQTKPTIPLIKAQSKYQKKFSPGISPGTKFQQQLPQSILKTAVSPSIHVGVRSGTTFSNNNTT